MEVIAGGIPKELASASRCSRQPLPGRSSDAGEALWPSRDLSKHNAPPGITRHAVADCADRDRLGSMPQKRRAASLMHDDAFTDTCLCPDMSSSPDVSFKKAVTPGNECAVSQKHDGHRMAIAGCWQPATRDEPEAPTPATSQRRSSLAPIDATAQLSTERTTDLAKEPAATDYTSDTAANAAVTDDTINAAPPPSLPLPAAQHHGADAPAIRPASAVPPSPQFRAALPPSVRGTASSRDLMPPPPHPHRRPATCQPISPHHRPDRSFGTQLPNPLAFVPLPAEQAGQLATVFRRKAWKAPLTTWLASSAVE